MRRKEVLKLYSEGIQKKNYIELIVYYEFIVEVIL